MFRQGATRHAVRLFRLWWEEEPVRLSLLVLMSDMVVGEEPVWLPLLIPIPAMMGGFIF
jgi:hypothetical protein